MSGALCMMAGGAPFPVLPSNIDVEHDAGGSATAGLTVDDDGNIYVIQGASSTLLARWIGGDVSAFEVRLLISGGTLSSGTADTFQSISTGRSYSVTQGSPGSKLVTATLQIRRGSILASCPVTLDATVFA